MNKKLIFTSLATTALLAACTSEELVPQANEVADVLASRPKIDVAFGVDVPATRMQGFGTGQDGNYFRIGFTKEDKLGAVLVDQGNANPANYYDLVTSNTHIGNNRFDFDETIGENGKFVTTGTMCVGAWLFYAQFNEANTKNRGAIEYEIPVVQEYAQDFTKMAENDFRFSPIVNLTGYDDGYFNDFNLPTISAYTYANVKLTFPKAVKVQKLVLKPYQDGTTGGPLQIGGTNYDPFSSKYALNVPGGLSEAVAQLNKTFPWNYANDAKGNKLWYYTMQDCLDDQADKLLAKDNYIQATVATGKDEQLIALNCLEANLEANKEFQAYMLIPSGKYDGIRLYAYTDQGVYAYNINDENEAATEKERKENTKFTYNKDESHITLKREQVSLHNIKDLKGEYAETKAIAMTEVKTNADLQKAQETEGTVVISQKDLKAVIDGISNKGTMNVRVLGNMVKITKEIADAIAAKEDKIGDIQVVFDKSIDVVGTPEGYNLTDITFNGGAVLTTGTVNIDEHIDIPAKQTFTVKSGATLNVNKVAYKLMKGDKIIEQYFYTNFQNNGTMNLDVDNLTIGSITNNGTLNVEKTATVTTITNNAKKTITVNADLNTSVTNSGVITNNADALNITGAESKNSGKIVNKNVMHIKSTTLSNTGTIENNEKAKIISGEARTNDALLNNTGTIENSGYLYCYNGKNFIYNVGTINAKSGSTTYITRNSITSEYKVAATNGTYEETVDGEVVTKKQKLGTINMDSRDEDISVTTADFQGYLTYTAKTTDTFTGSKSGDKFNKLIFTEDSKEVEVNYSRVKYIVSSTPKLNINKMQLQELTFNTDCTLSTNGATVAYLEIAKDKIVKIPTENVITIDNVTTNITSETNVQINNNGTLLVGGDLWAPNIEECPEKGIFASGDGTKTAFHWGEPQNNIK